jgi:hypothetical protein
VAFENFLVALRDDELSELRCKKALEPADAAQFLDLALQLAKCDSGENRLELLPPLPGKGFARLPQPDPGDIFFDMEGYPFYDDGSSLEYLFGFVTADARQTPFNALWAHDRTAEKRAFEHTMDFITARLQEHPGAYVYHYGNYEEAAIKRLAMVHGTRESEVDDLLRRRRLVDVYKVVREAVRISEPGLSLKNVEVFYSGTRAGEVTTALDIVVVYDRWVETGDASALEEIAAYNEADCRSLLMCRDWLLSLRPPEIPWFGGGPITEADARALDPAREARRKEAEERNAELVRALVEGMPASEVPWRELAGQRNASTFSKACTRPGCPRNNRDPVPRRDPVRRSVST